MRSSNARLTASTLALALAALAGCSFPTGEFVAATPTDVPRDTGRDASLDVMPDVSPDVASDVSPDVAPDVAPDVTPDVTADVIPDAPPSDGGACTTNAECGSGRLCCDRMCVDAQSSTAHCGRCGNVCDPPNGTPACVMGVCGVGACDPGFGNCDMNPTNGCEVDLNGDPANCGRCATRCPTAARTNATCTAGRCESSCARGFGDCDMNPANGCEADLTASTTSCGACARTCPAGANATAGCNFGDCELRCATNFGDCDENPANGCEVNTSTSATNCGSCGVACAFANATATCASGACAIGACATGFGNCDGMAANGCETPTGADPSNCGACGTRCAAGSACLSGRCVATCSPAPLMMCGATCVDSATNLTNCGACGRACAPSNATGECRAGACAIASCAAGFGDCDTTPSNGCEATLNTDVANCGGCRLACNRTNGTPSCVAGACAIACSAGFANCDGDASDGCEIATATDPRNCGRCGNTCALANATAGCAAGACTVATCATGFGNCDGMAANGCETLTASDEANCGRCGLACPAGQYCVSGACTTLCGRPLSLCGTRCVNLLTDAANCGACGRACGTGLICSAARCIVPPPSNDTCAAATEINLAAGSRITLSVNMTSAAHELDSPCDTVGGGDAFYRFTLTRRELIYADTFGTTWDTKLFLANSCTTPIRASLTPSDLVCDDNLGPGCTTGGTASQIYTVLNPGTYYLVLSSNGTASTATIHFEHLNVGTGALNLLGRGTSIRSGVTVAGITSGYTSSCGGSGPEQAFWWTTCPEQVAGALSASTCSRATWNTVLSVVSGGGSGDLCNDNGTSCSPQSTLSSTIAAGPGLHALVVDGFGSAAGTYTVLVTRP